MELAINDPAGARAAPDLSLSNPVSRDTDAAIEELYKGTYLRLVRLLYAMTAPF
jgi:hypothetical protein